VRVAQHAAAADGRGPRLSEPSQPPAESQVIAPGRRAGVVTCSRGRS